MSYTAAEELEQAKREYKLAELRLRWATEPGLVDAAALEISAARLRIDAAVRRAKLEQIAGRRSA